MSIKIATLMENNTSRSELYKEHGLSIYIQADDKCILFDTGQTDNYLKNAEKLNIDLSQLDYIVLSHSHYDHTGGLNALTEKGWIPDKLLVGNGFFNEKYKSVDNKELKYIGYPFKKSLMDMQNISIEEVSSDMVNLSENIMLFSNFQRKSDYEHLNNKFYVKYNDTMHLDHFKDEVVLAAKMEKGLFVILGCSHVGVVNILETISQRTNMNIYGIVGGTHLVDADDTRIENTIVYLKEKNIQKIGVSHCTGEKAEKRLKEAFGDKFFQNHGGNVIELKT